MLLNTLSPRKLLQLVKTQLKRLYTLSQKRVQTTPNFTSYCPSPPPKGAAKGLYNRTIKRFSDFGNGRFWVNFQTVTICTFWCIAAKRLVISTKVISKTPLKIQFYSRKSYFFGSEFAKTMNCEKTTLNS